MQCALSIMQFSEAALLSKIYFSSCIVCIGGILVVTHVSGRWVGMPSGYLNNVLVAVLFCHLIVCNFILVLFFTAEYFLPSQWDTKAV